MAVSDTLRGFRTQFLYTIHRVVSDCDSEAYYVPEGVEDLDIRKNELIVETVQIKNYKKPIQPSDLYSPSKSTSFFKRALETISTNEHAIIRLVSFSSLSSDLQNSTSIQTYLHKNSDKEIKKNAKCIARAYKSTEVDEDTLYDEIVEVLKQQFPAFNPDKELRYLLQWVYEKAEQHQGFTYIDLIKELNCYQSFENRQICASKDLGVSIIPLFQDSLSFDKAKLKEDFLSGLSARPEHISFDLDVRRPDRLSAIESAFKEQNVVIINGASGQGKSVLSYRYIMDNCAIAYEIKSCDRHTLCNLRASLTEICKGMSVPILLYFDAKPADDAWIELVRTFAPVKNVRCLISLRNEDWNQYRSRLGNNVLFKDVELTLAKEEARQIYNQLCSEPNLTNNIFETIWEKFGKKAALLEFVYFISHKQALRDKLISQWQDLQPEDLLVVEKIILVNYFGGRINRWSDILCDGKSKSAVQKCINQYNGEFFIDNGQGLLESAHPLRTKILVESVYGENKKVMNREALELYFKADMADSHLYLLNLLKKGVTITEIYDSAIQHTGLSGSQFAGIVRTLIWKGSEEYLISSRPLIDQLKEKVGSFWEYCLPVNFTEIDIKQSIGELLSKSANYRDVNNLLDGFPSQDSIFHYLNKFLDNKIKIDLRPNDDWTIVADALYRISLSKHLTQIELNGQLDVSNLSTDELSKILLGLKSVGMLEDRWKELENHFIEKLRIKYLITNFCISDISVEATSFIRYTSDVVFHSTRNTEDYSTNYHLVRIVELLRMSFPEKENYHVTLGEDALSSIAIDSEKNIQRTNLPIDAMREIRSCIVNQYKNSIGIPDKSDYVERLNAFRQELVRANQNVVNVFSKWRKNNKFDTSTYNISCQTIGSAGNNIPQMSYISSNVYGYGDIQDITQEVQGSSWNSFVNDMTSYISNLSGFYSRMTDVMKKRDNNCISSKACLFDALFALKRMQTKFKEMFGLYIPSIQDYESFEKTEYESLLSMWVIWETQCLNLTGISFASQKIRFRQMEESLPKLIINNIKERLGKEKVDCKCNLTDAKLNISIPFKNKEEYEKAIQVLNFVLCDVLRHYNTYTSQEYILRCNFEDIRVQFLFVDNLAISHRISSIVYVYNLRHLLEVASKYPEGVNMLCTTEIVPIKDNELADYEEFMGLVASFLVISNQLSIMYQNVESTDEIGKIAIKQYEEDCAAEYMTYIAAINRLKVMIRKMLNATYYEDIAGLISILETAQNSKRLVPYFKGVERLMQSISKNDIQIRISLISQSE